MTAHEPSCRPYRDALSAIADGEVSPVSAGVLDAHVGGCAMCTAFAASLGDLHRRVRVMPAEPVPNLTAAILAAVDTPVVTRARARFTQLRAILALIGVAQLLTLVPLVASGQLQGPHATREVAIFQLALAVGFLVVAWRPARAIGLFPVVAVVALLATAAGVGDVVAGRATLLAESTHLLELLGTGVLWVVIRSQRQSALQPVLA